MFVINFSQWASLEKTDRDGETLTSKIFGPFSFGKKIWDVFFSGKFRTLLVSLDFLDR